MKISKNNLRDVYKAKLASVETMELKGYELIENMFVDSSGFGMESEPALTLNGFETRLNMLIEQNGGMVYASITNAGQFQVYVGIFKKAGKSRIKKIANNTYEIYSIDGILEAIRLHDTNILTYESDHVTLDNGGYQTKTTKERLNAYLPQGVSIVQRDFTWYIHDTRCGTCEGHDAWKCTREFTNGMIIAS